MKKKIILVVGVFIICCLKLFSQTDIGFKSDCFEFYYPNIVYGGLLSIIDTNTRNTLIEKNYDDSCKFRVYLTLNIETGFLENIIIRDTCSLVPREKKEEFKSLLNKIQFDICHEDYWRREKRSKEICKNPILFSLGNFSTWWRIKTTLRKED